MRVDARAHAVCAWTALLCLAPGCVSPPSDLVSIEARGAIDGPYVLDAAYLMLLLIAYGDDSNSNNSSRPQNRPGGGDLIDARGPFLRNGGLQLSINTSLIDLVASMDQHNIGDDYVPQERFGLRKRFDGTDMDAPYVQVMSLRGFGARTDTGRENYDGISISVGNLAQIDDHWFIDLSIEYQSTFQRLEFDGEDARQNSVALNIGVGYSF